MIDTLIPQLGSAALTHVVSHQNHVGIIILFKQSVKDINTGLNILVRVKEICYTNGIGQPFMVFSG